MTNKKQPIKCSECQYCSGIRPMGNTCLLYTSDAADD